MCFEVPHHAAVFINKPRLSEFKQIVVSKGIQAEMSGGVLICNNVVAVRRVSGVTCLIHQSATLLVTKFCIESAFHSVDSLFFQSLKLESFVKSIEFFI